MSLKRIALLIVLAGAVAWLVAGRPVPRWTDGVDGTVTGSTAPAPRGVPLPVRVIVAQSAEPETPPPASPAPDATAPAAPPVAVPSNRPSAGANGNVDESALRYFARQGDERRLNAEIARLKALYPGWEPPANPAAPEVFTDPELDQLWQLFSEGKYAEARSAIADRRAREPGWAPPAALIELLDQADARVRLTNASDAKQWKTVIDVAAATPSLLTCDYVDVLWRVAEAFARTARPERAKDAYIYVLTNCNDEAERVATLQKALTVLTDPEVASLLRYDRGNEFASINDELIRRRVSALAEKPELKAEAQDLTRIEELAKDSGSAADALILGWYYYRHADPGKALPWFAAARERDPKSAKAAEGYTLSLVALGRHADAETAGYDWNEAAPENLNAYLSAAVGLLATDPPLKIAEPVLQRIAKVVVRVKSLAAGEQLGWYAYNLRQVNTAYRWFQTISKWDPQYEPGAYGLAVTLLRLNQRSAANQIIRAWSDRSERIAQLAHPVRAELRGSTAAVETATDELPVILPEENPVQPVEENPVYPAEALPVVGVEIPPSQAVGGGRSRCAGGGPPVNTLSPESALVRGWCLMDLNRPVEAAVAFEIALQSANAKTRSDAAYGASLANIRTGVTDKAAVAAAAAPLSVSRQKELTIAILTQRASAAFADGRYVETILALDERVRYAPEQTDLLMLRGFAYFKLGRYGDAKQIFEAVAATGVPDAVRGLAAVQAAQGGFGRGVR